MIHYQTKNISFLKMHSILESLDINNSSFFLELFDPSIADLDYFDTENLTAQQKLRILREIHVNPWFFLREIVLIPASGGNVPFNINRGTLAIIWAILNNLSSITVVPRQTGKTYAVCAVYLWLFYFGSRNTQMMLFSYKDDILQASLQRIKDIRDNLPSYLNLMSNNDKDNAREMRFEAENYFNHIRIKAPPTSKDSALKTGRGFSVACMSYDEVTFISNIKDIYESSVFAYKTAAEAAKKQNSYYHRVMTTSAGHLNNEEGQWCFNFINSSCEFNEKMYDLETEQIHEIISKNSLNNFLYITFMYYDLSLGDDYIEQQRKDSVSEDAFRREVLNSWEKTGEDHPLGQEIVRNITNYIHKPNDVIIIDNIYFLKLYRPLNEIDFSKKYIGGVDCGGNLLQDFSTCVIVDPANFEVIATLRTNSFSTNRFSKALVYIMIRIFTGLILVPERNSMGIAIIDYMIDNFPQLYRRIYHEPPEKGDKTSKNGEKPGFNTNNKTRPLLFNNLLKIAVQEDYTRFHDMNIIYEIIGLIVTRSGRIDHDPKGHDDTLIAYLIVRWFLAYAKNKSKYIEPTLIGTEVHTEEQTMNEEIKAQSKGHNINFKGILFNNSNAIISDDGTINTASLNPRTHIVQMDREREMNAVGVENAFDVINTRLKDRDTIIDRNLKTMDPELLPDEEAIYEENPKNIPERTKEKQTPRRFINNEEASAKPQLNPAQIRGMLGL